MVFHKATLILSACIFLLVQSYKLRAQNCECEVSRAKEQLYDSFLVLDDAQQADISNKNLRVPVWVANKLTREQLKTSRERLECFRRDPRIDGEADAEFFEDYDAPIYYRGHMVPNADMPHNEAAMINTYMFTNMAQGLWGTE